MTQAIRHSSLVSINRAASNGDYLLLKSLLNSGRISSTDNVKDEDGMSPLIQAACFGHERIVKMLIETRCDLDQMDDNGWTALVWASANGHMGIVQILIDAGASTETKTSQGHTIKDLVSTEKRRDLNCILQQDNHFQDAEESEEDESQVDFNWETCDPDQMIVFNAESIESIIQVVVGPSSAGSKRFLAASVIFLCARYAHNYDSKELVQALFDNAFTRILGNIKENKNDVGVTSFWLSNMTFLLYSMKRDQLLVVSSFQSQLSISEFIHDLFMILYRQIQKKIVAIIDGSILDYSSITSTAVQFENTLHSLTRKSILKAGSHLYEIATASQSLASVKQQSQSPKSLTNMLTSLHLVLLQHQVHPVISSKILEQTFYYLSQQIFNGILFSRDRCCRSRGVAIRMNISLIEEWAKEHLCTERSYVSDYLKPAIHLAQFLQVVTLISQPIEIKETLESLDGITVSQAKRALENYKYEVGENSTAQVEEYLNSAATNDSTHSMLEFMNPSTLKMDPTFMVPFQIPQFSSPDGSWKPSSRNPAVSNEALYEIFGDI